MDPQEILLENIKEVIPSILYRKFCVLNITNMHEVLSINIDDFRQIDGIGLKITEKLTDFKNYAMQNMDELSSIHENNTRIHLLPSPDENQGDFNLIEQVNLLINSYLELINREEMRGVILHQYGLNGNEVFSLQELSNYYSLSSERLRQIKNLALNDIQLLLEGSFLPELRCKSVLNISTDIRTIKDELISEKFLTKIDILNLFRNRFECRNIETYLPIVNILIDVFGFERCGKIESNFTESELISTEPNERKKHIKSALLILKVLKKEIIPISEMRIQIDVRAMDNELEQNHINKSLRILPEIERVNRNGRVMYQLKIEHLSTATDKAYRVLSENGEPMHIDDILSEVNSRISHNNPVIIYDRPSLGLSSDDRFISIAKSGEWALRKWNHNTQTLELLVITVLNRLNAPSSIDEIVNGVLSLRTNVNIKSLKSIIGRDCLKLGDGRWILPTWQRRYSNFPLAKRRRRINTHEQPHRVEQRNLIINYLSSKENCSEMASRIIRDIGPLNRKYTKISFYKIFNNYQYFVKQDYGYQIRISLRNQDME